MSKKKNNAPVKKSSTKPAAKQAVKNQPASQSKLDVMEIVKVAGILTAICIVISAALAGVNLLTADRIAQIAKENEFAACEQVFPPAEGQQLEFTSFEELNPDSGINGYLATENGSAAGCVIITAAKGYGGDVQVMVGFDMNKTVTGVSVLSHSETPGLGANAAKPGFLEQFIGIADAGNLAVAKDGGSVDAVTAATISSRAVTNAINSAAGHYDQLAADGMLASAAPEVSASDAAVSGSDVSGSDVSGSDIISNSDSNTQGGAQ